MAKLTSSADFLRRQHQRRKRRRAGFAGVSGGGGGGLLTFASYLGAVASPSRAPIARVAVATAAQSQCRKRYIAHDDISVVRLVYGAWYYDSASGGVQVGAGGTQTISAGIEYPVGTLAVPGPRTRITFAASNDGSAASSNNVVSDDVTLSTMIPRGAEFFVWTFRRAAGFLVYQVGSVNLISESVNGGAYHRAVSGLTDICTSGTFTHSQNTMSDGPLEVLGQTTRPSVMFVGDSRGYGSTDNFDSTPYLGSISRALGAANIAHSSFACPSMAMDDYIAAHFNSDDFWPNHTHMILGLGTNDYNAGESLATIQSRINTILGYCQGAGMRLGLITIPTQSTGAWTLANLSDQTPSGGSAVKNTGNDWVRTKPAGIWKVFEVADYVDSARNSGKWKADGTVAKYTADGIHETPFAFQAETAGLATQMTEATFYQP